MSFPCRGRVDKTFATACNTSSILLALENADRAMGTPARMPHDLLQHTVRLYAPTWRLSCSSRPKFEFDYEKLPFAAEYNVISIGVISIQEAGWRMQRQWCTLL